jgi:hypothetical protein
MTEGVVTLVPSGGLISGTGATVANLATGTTTGLDLTGATTGLDLTGATTGLGTGTGGVIF